MDETQTGLNATYTAVAVEQFNMDKQEVCSLKCFYDMVSIIDVSPISSQELSEEDKGASQVYEEFYTPLRNLHPQASMELSEYSETFVSSYHITKTHNWKSIVDDDPFTTSPSLNVVHFTDSLCHYSLQLSSVQPTCAFNSASFPKKTLTRRGRKGETGRRSKKDNSERDENLFFLRT
ncbi:hypothetical protein C0J52_24991 [Blattella germanica]|nr:hypothetical protein C0J52_24991 [Blattella germanica]